MSVLSKLLRKAKTTALPLFPAIGISDLPPATVLVFYGRKSLTSTFANRVAGHKYKPAAFHAAFYIDGGIYLNVGKFKQIEELSHEFRSTRRIDAFIYKDVTDAKRKSMTRNALLDASKHRGLVGLPDYGWRDFLRFGLKVLKPSRKDFCSENVVELFAHEGVQVSNKPAVDTAPWDLFDYALQNVGRGDVEIRTLWVGQDFGA